ncbi:dihydrofolate reductase family protein [Archangium violaceum]|uniref:Deaminase n=1 Tax=Archangium violaceum Cb vi76 TaxID=1406225 RepID=A0A084SMR7_9BACT|nr:dihydrofolate reductase family protein [Archangium violaceum]KFA89752.1 deaminase [Archangium violaceum Cb vi76]
MRKIFYLMNVSLDGYVEAPDGGIAWSNPDEEVHQFFTQQIRDCGAFLYGRRMYEVMRVWQTMGVEPSASDFEREFGRIWRAVPKVVFSTTLEKVGENCRLVRDDLAAEAERLKQQPGEDLMMGGPGLASSFARLGLIDEYRLVVCPIILGGGKRYFPALEREVPLRLVETRTFQSGTMYLRYQRA